MLRIDGMPYRMLAGWISLVYVGFLWLLGALLVVTAPASTFALFNAVRRVAYGEGSPSPRLFVRDMIANFWPATRVGLAVATGWAVAVLTFVSPLPPGFVALLTPFVVIPVVVMWALTTVWVFPILVERRSGARDAFRVGYLRTVRRPMHAIAAITTAGLVIALPFLVPPTIALPFWLTAIGGSALAISVFTSMAAPSSSSHNAATALDITAAAISAVGPKKEAQR